MSEPDVWEDVTEYVEWFIARRTVEDIREWMERQYFGDGTPVYPALDTDARNVHEALVRARVTVELERRYRMTVQYVLPEEDDAGDIGDFVMNIVHDNAESIVAIDHVATRHGLTGFELTVVYRTYEDKAADIEEATANVVSNANGSLIYIKTKPHREDGGE